LPWDCTASAKSICSRKLDPWCSPSYLHESEYNDDLKSFHYMKIYDVFLDALKRHNHMHTVWTMSVEVKGYEDLSFSSSNSLRCSWLYNQIIRKCDKTPTSGNEELWREDAKNSKSWASNIFEKVPYLTLLSWTSYDTTPDLPVARAPMRTILSGTKASACKQRKIWI
jgi:hypothetical protein